jgi:hypothetical protein
MSFTTGQLGELQNALDDAIEYRGPDNSHCPECTHEEMCGDHAGTRRRPMATGSCGPI